MAERVGSVDSMLAEEKVIIRVLLCSTRTSSHALQRSSALTQHCGFFVGQRASHSRTRGVAGFKDRHESFELCGLPLAYVSVDPSP